MEILIVEKPPAWEPTHRQWICWMTAHLTLFVLFAAASVFDMMGMEDRNLRNQLFTVVFVSWVGATLMLSWIPVWLDNRLSWIWKILGMLTFLVTLPLAWVIEMLALLFVLIGTGNFSLDGIQ